MKGKCILMRLIGLQILHISFLTVMLYIFTNVSHLGNGAEIGYILSVFKNEISLNAWQYNISDTLLRIIRFFIAALLRCS